MTTLKLNKKALKEKELRAKRLNLFKAFDILKSNIYFGIDHIDSVEQQALIKWYEAALDLEEEAINNPPAILAKYVI